MKPLAERLWARTTVAGPDECWEWQGCKHPFGHGQIGRGRREEGICGTHVAAWEVTYGRRVPEGKIVRHACDNPSCCNPSHLLLGTKKDNTADMVARRRHRHGEAHATKLTERDVVAIREMLAGGSKQHEVASRFGVARSTVGLIGRYKIWALTQDDDPSIKDGLIAKPIPGKAEACSKGHLYADVGFYQTARSRICKACQKERVAKYMENGGRQKKAETSHARYSQRKQSR